MSLPTFGASGILVADLDADGKPEVVFANGRKNSVEGIGIVSASIGAMKRESLVRTVSS